jgi:hypothetical protein
MLLRQFRFDRIAAFDHQKQLHRFSANLSPKHSASTRAEAAVAAVGDAAVDTLSTHRRGLLQGTLAFIEPQQARPLMNHLNLKQLRLQQQTRSRSSFRDTNGT